MIGQRLNQRYTITARLGKGAMGTVYRATDAQTRQEMALKVIASDLAVDPAMLERFKREGEALRQLKHPNIVGFTDAFEHDEHYVIVMEYVAGGSLYDLIKKGPLTIERATQIALDLCDALIRSHRLKIIHRDIKPENVLIAEDGTPKLADFGVARLSEGTRMTRSGMQVGTPYYMAPEAWEGKTLDAQADIWSLGVVLFEMLTGQVPFGGDTPHAVLNKVSNTPPPDLKKLRADVPHGLARIITRMLTRDLDQRYQTMREVAVDLERGEPATTPMAAKAKPARKKKETKKPGFVNKKTIGIAGVVILLLSVGALGLNTLIQNFPFATASTSSPEGLATSALPTSTPALAEEITDARGITMRLVPAGSFTMGSEEYDVTKPVHEVYLDAFWMDQTEVTNAMYAKCVEDGLCQEPHFAGSLTQPRYYGNSEFDNYPVIHVEWNMANIYCGWREASLPTEAQWEKAARGTDGRTYPWGESYGADHSNDINQNEGDTVAVGSYEIGKSPYGIYDMSGNVDEWVADWFSDTYYQNSPSTNPLGPETGQFRVLRGGSWNDNTQTYYRDNNGPGFSSDDVGFRCARSAARETLAAEPQPSLTPTSLSTEITDPKGITMRLVPEGTFMMGSNNGGDDEKPIHEVYLDTYYMDIYEVTIAAYKVCVDDGNCEQPRAIGKYNIPSYANHPVTYINWESAETYCQWRGAKLPTEAEWEKAARGTDGRIYPWGNDAPNKDLLNFNGNTGDTTEVGSYESGKSPYGIYDMAGNVWEWVSSLYQPYPYDANDGREDLTASGSRVRRGGSWVYDDFDVRSADRSGNAMNSSSFHGFRCAVSP